MPSYTDTNPIATDANTVDTALADSNTDERSTVGSTTYRYNTGIGSGRGSSSKRSATIEGISFIDNIEVERIDASNAEAQGSTRVCITDNEESALQSADQQCAAGYGKRSIL